MNTLEKLFFVSLLFSGLLAFTGFDGRPVLTHVKRVTASEVSRHVALLKSRDAQQKAAAAYWLGLQRADAVSAVNSLAALLGDKAEVDASRYHDSRDETGTRHPRRLTVGEEAALALVKIGRPATDVLINVLTSSPEPHARKNAAWALGAIREGATGDSQPDDTTNQTLHQVAHTLGLA
jgi:HEAT repeat protein